MAYATGQLPTGFGTDVFGNFLDGSPNVVLVPIPAYPGPPAIPWAFTWVSLAAENGTAKIRYALYNDVIRDWQVGFVVVDHKKGLVGLPIREHDSIVSLARVPQDSGNTLDTAPVSWIVQAVLQG
ncbi:hypothetical protein ABT095_20100 [Kitasatospora sp. NPDC002227]|uniref:hypothetical protein n=1 Tax=Kitasatospora sp. NPDC002227 TaxID=3154773 RepID=UPI00331A346A